MNMLSTYCGKYEEDEPIRLILRQKLGANRVEWTLWHLTERMSSGEVSITSEQQLLILPAQQSGGYGVICRLYRDRELLCEMHTAVNVGGEIVRYGFLCDFEKENETAVRSLASWHITHVQFYDWSWRPEEMVSGTDEYRDLMDKQNSLSAIRSQVKACRSRGMKTMAYGAVYAASREFRDLHPDWGLYGPDHTPMSFIEKFCYMDPDSPWRDHLFEQYTKAITEVGFDGIHMDTYGEPKKALIANGQVRNLQSTFPQLIRDINHSLRMRGITPHLIFNNVGTWPVTETRDCPQDAVYMELWPLMDRYRHIRDAIEIAGDHPTVLAAYPAAFRTDTPERALYSQLFLSFAIAIHGGTQLFLGEQNAVVTQGYYADYSLLNDEQTSRIRDYEDFQIQYGDLLYDRSLKDVTRTHIGGDNAEYEVNIPYSIDGEPDRVWIHIRENMNTQLIGLINLCGNEDDLWNTGKRKPIPQDHMTLSVLMMSTDVHVWYASPDDESRMHPMELGYTAEKCNYGWKIIFRIPKLQCCGLVWITSAGLLNM